MKIMVHFCWIYSFLILNAQARTFDIIGDAGVWNSTTKELRSSIYQSDIKELIIPGDNIYDTTQSYKDIWDNWLNWDFEFSVVAIGNHTLGYQQEMNYFKLPAEYFSKNIGSNRFIVLNSDNTENVLAQTDFLNTELQKAQEDFVFIVYHHPPFSLRHSWKERAFFHLSINPVLEKYKNKITAIIVGHDHVATLVNWNDIPVIVSGASWESFKIPPINVRDQYYTAKTYWTSRGGFYWTKLDTNSKDKTAWVNFIQVTKGKKLVQCSARIFPRPTKLKENCRPTPQQKDPAPTP